MRDIPEQTETEYAKQPKAFNNFMGNTFDKSKQETQANIY